MSIDPRFHLGVRALQAGDWPAATAQFRAVVEARPGDAEALFYLGVSLLSGGRAGEAVAPLERLVRKDGRNPAALNALGSTLAATGERTKAGQMFRRALAVAPAMPEAAENLGRLLLDEGKPAEAMPLLEDVVRREPGRLGALMLLGQARMANGDGNGAEAAFKTILERQPESPAALNALGLLYHGAGMGEQALDCFDRILARMPGDPVAGNNRAMSLASLGRAEEAERQYREVLAKAPDLPQVHLNLGKLLSRQDRAAEGIPHLDRVDSFEARWWSALVLPLMYESDQSRLAWRERYLSGLARLKREFDGMNPARRTEQIGVLEKENFFLPYQAENDRDPQAALGGMQAAIAEACHRRHMVATAPRQDTRIRVGFLSAHLYNHTISKLFTGWMLGLDRADFEVFVFYAGRKRHAETEAIETGVEHFVTVNMAVDDIIRTVSASGLDVLIHLDVGMSPVTHTLAALRLAPVQCVAVGHPVTTGLPTMDYFLSGELIEPADGESHYTERLIRLPGVGFGFTAPPVHLVPDPVRASDAPPAFFCAQSLWKLVPRHDHLFARIAEQTGPCSMGFCAWAPEYAAPLAARLDKAFGERGLRMEDYVTIHPRMSQFDFLSLMKAADVSLDSLEWSGGNTTMEALACGTPVVTVPGRFMRGRVSAGILVRAGLEADLVAADGDDYVAKAVRLGMDRALRGRVSQAMLAAAPEVFRDQAGLAGLAAFIRSVARS